MAPPAGPVRSTTAVGLFVAALLAALLAAALAAAPLLRPLAVACPESDMPHQVCLESVDAALARGLPSPHPLVLTASVVAGPDTGPAQYGHRATVTFELLALPATAEVRLYYDMGGHWGGELERSAEELALWWGLPVLLLAALAIAAGGLAWRSRRRPTA